jgi:hypothetical protein
MCQGRDDIDKRIWSNTSPGQATATMDVSLAGRRGWCQGPCVGPRGHAACRLRGPPSPIDLAAPADYSTRDRDDIVASADQVRCSARRSGDSAGKNARPPIQTAGALRASVGFYRKIGGRDELGTERPPPNRSIDWHGRRALSQAPTLAVHRLPRRIASAISVRSASWRLEDLSVRGQRRFGHGQVERQP